MATKAQLLTDSYYLTNYVTDITNQQITTIIIITRLIKRKMKTR